VSQSAETPPKGRMTRAAYRAWAEQQPRGRYELVRGEVVAMAPERGAHLRAKLAAALALRRAIAEAGVPCQALPDGATVEVGDNVDYEPDALVNCGEPMADDAVAAPNPVVVVEVLSPGTRSVDTAQKLVDYFRVPSIRHFLILDTRARAVIHHRRAGEGDAIETRLVRAGAFALDPPGISVAVEEFWAA
jgi:Uma2 family endonuclease